MRQATRSWILGAACCSFMLSPISLCAEPIIHEPTGIAFPDKIGPFLRGDVVDHESKRPGLGFSFDYEAPTGALATVYVYTGGLSQVPLDIRDPAMIRAHERSIGDIRKVAKMQEEAIRDTQHSLIQVQTGKREIFVYFDSFVVSGKTGSRNTYLVLWSSRGHFAKLRLTFDENSVLSPNDIAAFYKAVVRLTAD